MGNKDTGFIFKLGVNWGRADFFSDGFSVKVVETEVFEKTLKTDPDQLMTELEKKGEVKLEGIYFDTAKATLKPTSSAALLAAASLMKKYPTLVLEVQGHTDSVGDDEVNQELSNERAASVKVALIQEGIEANRLQSKGFGEQAPIADNNTDVGRALNHRVMLKHLGGGSERALITIDFMQPIPGFKRRKVHENHQGKLNFLEEKEGQKVQAIYFGHEVWADYQMIDKSDKTFSALEIRKNYRPVLAGC